MVREPILRGPHDAPPLLGGQRPRGLLEAPAALHLDDGEALAFQCDEIDLPHRVLKRRAMMR
jgi:hypothetical protein